MSPGDRIEPLAERLPRLFGSMEDLLELAVEIINDKLGAGYAEKHPQLIQALLLSNAVHAFTEGLDERLLLIFGSLNVAGDALDNLKGAVLLLAEDRG